MPDFTLEDRVALTKIVLATLKDWGINEAQQIRLLALPETTKPRQMKRYYFDDQPLPDEKQTYTRIEHIMGIAAALRTSYPLNPAAGAVWLKRRNRRFGDRRPLEIMLEDGINGVLAIRTHLDCSYDWHLDDQKNRY